MKGTIRNKSDSDSTSELREQLAIFYWKHSMVLSNISSVSKGLKNPITCTTIKIPYIHIKSKKSTRLSIKWNKSCIFLLDFEFSPWMNDKLKLCPLPCWNTHDFHDWPLLDTCYIAGVALVGDQHIQDTQCTVWHVALTGIKICREAQKRSP